MFAALAEGPSHPAVAAWLAVGTAGLAAAVVAMVWSVNARQIRLAQQLARRQFLVTSETNAAGRLADQGGGAEIEGAPPIEGAPRIEGGPRTEGAPRAKPASRAKAVPPEVIEGPDEVIAGEQARYRVQSSTPHQVVTWAVGGGAVSHAPDPAHPGDLLLIADQPGDLTIIARVREGLTERRATKAVTAVPEATPPTPSFTLRLFLHGWGLVVVAVLIIGFAGALDALGNFTSSDFIALAVPLAALLGVIAVARGTSEPGGRPGNGHGAGAGAGKRHSQI
jgi:hypothetical protein